MFLNLLTCLVSLLAYICISLHNAYNPVHLVQSTKHLKVGATVETEAKENHVDHGNYFVFRQISLLQCRVEQQPSFLDFIRGG